MFWNYRLIHKVDLEIYRARIDRIVDLECENAALREMLKKALRNDFKKDGRFTEAPEDLDAFIDQELCNDT